jgi:hypothetical protein
MRVQTNVRVIKRNRQIAQYAFFISMSVWLGSLAITFLPAFTDRSVDQLGWLELVATAVLPFALALALFAVYMTNLWIREPRPEQVIRDGLKGMNKKSVLYHYHHSPAKHVLISPQGVFVMVVRWQRGNIIVNGDKWRFQRSFLARFLSLFRLESLGNPVGEAERARSYLARLLEDIAPDVEIEPLLVITDPRAAITVQSDSPVPIVYANEKNPAGDRLKPTLTDFMRERKTNNTEMPLTAEQIEAFDQATLPESE